MQNGLSFKHLLQGVLIENTFYVNSFVNLQQIFQNIEAVHTRIGPYDQRNSNTSFNTWSYEIHSLKIFLNIEPGGCKYMAPQSYGAIWRLSFNIITINIHLCMHKVTSLNTIPRMKKKQSDSMKPCGYMYGVAWSSMLRWIRVANQMK